jgi:hypothetical protein
VWAHGWRLSLLLLWLVRAMRTRATRTGSASHRVRRHHRRWASHGHCRLVEIVFAVGKAKFPEMSSLCLDNTICTDTRDIPAAIAKAAVALGKVGAQHSLASRLVHLVERSRRLTASVLRCSVLAVDMPTIVVIPSVPQENGSRQNSDVTPPFSRLQRACIRPRIAYQQRSPNVQRPAMNLRHTSRGGWSLLLGPARGGPP